LCRRFRLVDLFALGTVVINTGTRVHRFYDQRPKEIIIKHDNVFATTRAMAIRQLQEGGVEDAENMFIAAERAHIGYHLQSLNDQEAHTVPVTKENFLDVWVLLYYLHNEHN
jgi:hypothetical protein